MNIDQEQNIDDSGASPAESTSSADTDLASLMDEWNKPSEQKAEPKQEGPNTAPPAVQSKSDGPDLGALLKGMKPVISYTEKKMAEERKAEEDKIIQETISTLKGEDLVDIDDTLAEGFLFQRYQRDQSFQRAFDNRASDPASWKNALTEAQGVFKEKISPLIEKGNGVRTDLEAATAAVSGQSETVEEPEGPDNAELTKMSDSEFRAFKAALDPG